MEKNIGVCVQKRSSIHHCLVYEILRPWHVSEPPSVTKNLYYSSSDSCECERPGSVLKHLHTYLRASMGQMRLRALALLHNYDANIDIDNVIGIFAKRKEELWSLLILVCK